MDITSDLKIIGFKRENNDIGENKVVCHLLDEFPLILAFPQIDLDISPTLAKLPYCRPLLSNDFP
jgi:hypothetical protein